MRFLGGDYFFGFVVGERRDYLAFLFCVCFFNFGDSIRVNVVFICRSGVNCGYYGVYLRRFLGERYDYRYGGRMGY